MKKCTRCQNEQPLENFYIYKSGPREGKLWSHCKSCRKYDLYDWRKAKPEKYKENYKRGRYKYKYNLTLEEIPRFGKCPLCLKEKKLVVDHCHEKNIVRGFICYNCNTVLGHIEQKEKFQRMLDWIKNQIYKPAVPEIKGDIE